MKKLLSLPPNLVGCFHEITGYPASEWFCTNDPVGHKLGSGGGTTWLLQQAYAASLRANDASSDTDGRNILQSADFGRWLAAEKRLLLHAGGQSRRLPSYAPSGKILTPIPVFRWERGQRLSQDLLSLEVPFYQHIMDVAPPSLHTMVVSGDVFIRATQPLQHIPEADVVCYGLWLGPEIAKNHGVFVSSRTHPGELKCMLQKPSVETLSDLTREHFYLTDIGIWLFSDRAMKVLMSRSMNNDEVVSYDMYSDFGCALGTNPGIKDEEINCLSVAILPLPGGEFYHYGTSHEVLSSTLAIQNVVNDQREIMHHSRKAHPSIFFQNADVQIRPEAANTNLWIENSCVGSRWTLANDNIVTGVPRNDWQIELRTGQCVDIVPIGEAKWAVRPYGYNDKFRGSVADEATSFIGQPFRQWAAERQIDINAIECGDDLQSARIFPVVDNVHDAGLVLRWMLNEPYQQGGRMIWNDVPKMSADDISAEANLARLNAQRKEFRAFNLPFIAKNHTHSVFYQIDLDDAAHEFAGNHIAEPDPLSGSEPLMTRVHDAMFRSELKRLASEPLTAEKDKAASAEYERQAFALLRQGIIDAAPLTAHPKQDVYSDQIVWGRSPVRIDIAGGWTDTPPYCLMEGGRVINLAVELNGQPPLQAYVKPCKECHIVLRSIDLGASEVIRTYEELSAYNLVGSPFSIPKAALVLAGFHPDFTDERHENLEQQLRAFGSGIELTMLSAIPAGSGLGTSSILASTVLGALNDFCGLGWDKIEIGRRTLVLEQLLTTGGGWQDQFGGILQGVKLLQTGRGFDQTPSVRWLPSDLWTQAEYQPCHLLYYTGITRTAKTILSEIVRRMFLNHHDELAILRNMKEHTMEMFDAIQQANFAEMGRLVRRTWMQKQQIDEGTNPDAVRQLTRLVDDYCLGYKLPGAGGGGFLYMIAKDPDAAAQIKRILNENPTNRNARFVDMRLSKTGLQVSRS